MYVTKADYKGRISTSLLDMLISEDATGIIANASKAAEDTIQSMVGVLYDISGEFAKVNAARNFFLLSMAISIGLYNIYQIADDESIPEKIIKNYDDTIDDLTKISQGKMSLDFAPKPATPPVVVGPGGEQVTTTGIGLRRMGSQPKRTHNI